MNRETGSEQVNTIGTVFIPSLNDIHSMKVQPEKGEWKLIKHFQKLNLSNTTIYFQPNLNGDKPDFIIIRPGRKILIIEVKDWDLEQYIPKSLNSWIVRSQQTSIISPFAQIQKYHNNLVNLHLPELGENVIFQSKYFGMVHKCIYFSGITDSYAYSYFNNQRESIKRACIEILTDSSLERDELHRILNKKFYPLSTVDGKDDNRFYEQLDQILNPGIHYIDSREALYLSDTQQALAVSQPGKRQKIKGTAGCGKTIVLAQRAVNAHLRTKDNILILTFNITLRNYIHDKISLVRKEFNWKFFTINNYHCFFSMMANNLNLKYSYNEFDQSDAPGDFEDINFFEKEKDKIVRYPCILIDEIQDYKPEWMEIILKYFLAEGGELVVFGDEKQNIYGRPLEDKLPRVIGIPGKWNESLTIPYRQGNNLTNLAQAFQRHFLSHYQTDIIQQNELGLDALSIRYFHLEKNATIDEVYQIIQEVIVELKLTFNDTCILGSRIDFLRNLEYTIRIQNNYKSSITFETKEIYETLLEKHRNKVVTIEGVSLESELKKVRRMKKYNFYMGSGMVKISTIHSFKGWDIPNEILILDEVNIPDPEQVLTDELVYVGITRARKNLIIINLGLDKYEQFFSSQGTF